MLAEVPQDVEKGCLQDAYAVDELPLPWHCSKHIPACTSDVLNFKFCDLKLIYQYSCKPWAHSE